jgi:hypothetical protein
MLPWFSQHATGQVNRTLGSNSRKHGLHRVKVCIRVCNDPARFLTINADLESFDFVSVSLLSRNLSNDNRRDERALKAPDQHLLDEAI